MDDFEDLPHLKRFGECYQADPEFRESYRLNPIILLRKHGLKLEPARIEALLPLAGENNAGFIRPSAQSQRLKLVRKLQSEPVADARFQAWRQRQLKRIQAFYHVTIFGAMVHPPIAFELSKGCSGRCFFCCFAPPPLSGVFGYTGPDRELWREVLSISTELSGLAFSQILPCYFATEPFDNPHYENLVLDYHAVTGAWPPLTTIKSLDDPDRIRKYIRLVGADTVRAGLVRFSVNSLSMLREVHAEYSAEELADIELVLNNPESSWKYSPAGRARKLAERLGQPGGRMAEKFYMPGPTACVVGFVVNLVDRSIRLIATCTPDDRNPQGYILLGKVGFGTSADYRLAMNALIQRHMPPFPPDDWILAFNPAFKLKATGEGWQFSTDFITRSVRGDRSLIRMCEMIAEGRHTWREVCATFSDAWITEAYLKPKLSLLFDLGLLQELPS